MGVSASTPERSVEAARSLGVPRGYASGLEAALDKDVNVIHICTPNSLHMEVAKAALEAGKHVICEKPLCLNLAEADRMIEACLQANVKLMYADELCFAPKYERAIATSSATATCTTRCS